MLEQGATRHLDEHNSGPSRNRGTWGNVGAIWVKWISLRTSFHPDDESGFRAIPERARVTAVDGARTIDQLGRQCGVSRWFGFNDVVYLQSSARGGGSAMIDLVMRNPFSPQHEEGTERVLRHGDCNGLDEAAKELAEFWGLRLRVEEYSDD